MESILAILLLQVTPTEVQDQSLVKARGSRRPVCLLLIDDSDRSKALLKTFEQDEHLRTLGSLFELVKVKGLKPDVLLEMPLPVVVVAEPAWLPKDGKADWSLLSRACRGFLSLAGEFTPQDREIVDAIKASGRGGSQRIGPMDLNSCVPVIAGWISQKHDLKRRAVVLDVSVPEATRVEWQGGADHTFESMLQACIRQNKLIMYPSGGAIVLAGRPPREDFPPAMLRDFLGRHAETDEVSAEARDRLQEILLPNLAHDELEVREAATKELKELGAKARRRLRKALSEARDAETQSRLESLLQPVK